MPKRPHNAEEIDEDPSEEDLERFGGVTRHCPECNTELYDDSEICWKCGHALSAAPKGSPKWTVIIAVLILVALVFGYIKFF